MLLLTPQPQPLKKKQRNKETHQKFLNFGTFSSFEVSAEVNLGATAHPLQCKSNIYQHEKAC